MSIIKNKYKKDYEKIGSYLGQLTDSRKAEIDREAFNTAEAALDKIKA